ncbi:DNA/RNA non-specific endonuclease [Embleya sp. NPDC059267]
MERGHLLGRQLGGSGVEMRNLVPIYSKANDPGMKKWEDKVAAALSNNDVVYYTSRPIYENPGSSIPTQIKLTASGRTVNFSETVDNLP